MPPLPRPPYPKAPPPTMGVTSTRAWFLYGVAGFTQEQIEVLTGASRNEVALAVSRSRTTRGDDLQVLSSSLGVVLGVMRRLHVAVPTHRRTGDYLFGVTRLRRALRDAFVSGALGWDAVDALVVADCLAPLGLGERVADSMRSET